MCRNCTRHGQKQLLHIVYEALCHWIRFSSLLLLGSDLPTTHQPSQASLYLIAPSEAHLPLQMAAIALEDADADVQLKLHQEEKV